MQLIVSDKTQQASFVPPDRLLLGPGPAMVHERVYAAMSRPIIGHLDPVFLDLMDRLQGNLRRTFGTENAMTLPVSGTGSAGMQACFANLLEVGDEVVVGVNGVFGTRMADVAERLGARVRRVEAEWGEVIPVEALAEALAACDSPRLLAVVHAETSTGAWQPVQGLAQLAHDSGALLMVDAVTSLAGCPLEVDAWDIDACYSGTQKCLGCPPGLSPLTMSERAMQRVADRKSAVSSWYLDLGLIAGYFGSARVYHHTAPISMLYALDEALLLVHEEGLHARWDRHRSNHEALWAGLATLGLEPAASEGHRLWMLNSVLVPDGVDEAGLRRSLLEDHGIEIGPGLGPLAGRVWRIGLMGESSRAANVLRLLGALAQLLGGDAAKARRAAEQSGLQG
jgi:alanine-glyoxylate transaminase/serine-glyoxylate transaminase/serine-pyruvate transaminase